MRRSFPITAFFALVYFCASVSGAAASGTSGGQILEIHTSARVLGMGNSGVALVNDLNAIVYNPAGLAGIRNTQGQFSHIFYHMGASLNSVMAAGRYRETGIGLKYKIFYAKDVIRNAAGDETGEFDIRFHQYSMSAGRSVGLRHSLGATLNILREEYFSVSGAGFCINLGWRYRLGRNIWYFEPGRESSLGVAIRNLGPGLFIKGERNVALPLGISAGGSHVLDNWVVSWEVASGREDSIALKAGLEYELSDFGTELRLRAGANILNSPSLSLGIGVPESSWYLDYAMLLHGGLGSAHRFTYGINF